MNSFEATKMAPNTFSISVRLLILYAFSAMLIGLSAGRLQFAETGQPIVRAVLFASPTCQHCAKVREEVLPPLAARYGSQLKLVIISTATPSGYELFLSACMRYGLTRLSVPLLIVGNTRLVGADEIPLKFPGLIDKHLAEGGIDWPPIPGLDKMLASSPVFSADVQQRAEPATLPEQPPAANLPVHAEANITPVPKPSLQAPHPVEPRLPAPPAMGASSASPPSSSPKTKQAAPALPKSSFLEPSIALQVKESSRSSAETALQTAAMQSSGIIDLTGGAEQAGVVERIRRDIYGNGLAILVLAGMLLTILISPTILRTSGIPVNAEKSPGYDWVTPILTLAGLGVAAYLSYVELRTVQAICGPVGDCNTVQQSEYARLFGVLPIGILGLAGFLAILAAWIIRRWGSLGISLWASLGILCMAGFGTLFSIYLTFLEPFVIGATCLWCLSSSLIMTTLYMLALRPGRRAWSALQRIRVGPA
jgi:uncharacterized membrane protein